MTAVWLAEVQAAMAREIIEVGTNVDASVCAVGISKARAQPIRNTAANNSSRVTMPVLKA